MLLGRSVEHPEQCAALHPGALPTRIDANASHRGEIDHQPVMRDREADHTMSAAPHADLEVEIASSPHRCPDVPNSAAADDDAWAPVDHRVPHRARRVVAGIARFQHRAIEGLRELLSDHVTMTAVAKETHRALELPSPRDIFHITTEAEWARAQAEGAYSGSTRGL